MTYDNFKKTVKSKLADYLPATVTPKFIKITKNNDQNFDGLVLQTSKSTAAPTLYFNDLYVDYCRGLSMEHILETIADIYSRYTDSAISVENFTDFEIVKKHLCLKLINKKLNSDYLKNIPHRDYCDLALVCAYYDKITQCPSISTITKKQFELWNITEDELFKTAAATSPDVIKPVIEDLFTMLSRKYNLDAGFEPPIPMYFISNDDNYYGAICMTYTGILRDLADKFDENLAVIPSSVHEVLVLPCASIDELGAITNMVKQVNVESVKPGDVLSDHAYFYDRSTGLLSY